MNNKSILIFVVCAALSLNCISAQSKDRIKDTSVKTIKGGVTENVNQFEEISVLIPKDAIFEIDSLGNIKPLKPEDIEELKMSDDDGPTNSKDRLTKATSFLLLGGMSVTGSIERSLRDREAFGNLKDNFTNPVHKLKDGWKADDNAFLINYVGHPLEWFLIANYLKASGATDKEAIIISQLTNLTWEFVIEGSYVPPSPKDLATNTLGSLAGIYLYNVALKKPIDKTYGKLAAIGQKHGVDVLPDIKYNSNSRGMIIGALVKIKR